MELAKKHKVKAYCVLQVRYNPVLRAVCQALAEDCLGKIRSISLIQRWQRPEAYFASWRADKEIGGRTLYEVGIHYIDILQWIFGVPVVLSTFTFSNKHTKISFEDTVFSIVEYPNKASGSIEVTIASEPNNLECSISIMGSKGFIKIGGRALDKIETAQFSNQITKSKWDTYISTTELALQPNSYGSYAGSCPNHPTLYKAIGEGKGIPLEDAKNSIKFIESIYEKEIK